MRGLYSRHLNQRALVVAVCIVMEFAGMNARQYEALMDVLELRGVNPAWPNGIISHVAGFTKPGRVCCGCLAIPADL